MWEVAVQKLKVGARETIIQYKGGIPIDFTDPEVGISTLVCTITNTQGLLPINDSTYFVESEDKDIFPDLTNVCPVN